MLKVLFFDVWHQKRTQSTEPRFTPLYPISLCHLRKKDKTDSIRGGSPSLQSFDQPHGCCQFCNFRKHLVFVYGECPFPSWLPVAQRVKPIHDDIVLYHKVLLFEFSKVRNESFFGITQLIFIWCWSLMRTWEFAQICPNTLVSLALTLQIRLHPSSGHVMTTSAGELGRLCCSKWTQE